MPLARPQRKLSSLQFRWCRPFVPGKALVLRPSPFRFGEVMLRKIRSGVNTPCDLRYTMSKPKRRYYAATVHGGQRSLLDSWDIPVPSNDSAGLENSAYRSFRAPVNGCVVSDARIPFPDFRRHPGVKEQGALRGHSRLRGAFTGPGKWASSVSWIDGVQIGLLPHGSCGGGGIELCLQKHRGKMR
jgi:hypothetical protein